MKELDEIRGRLEAAAEGPWRWDENFDPEGDKDSGLALTNGSGVEIIGAYNYHCCSYRDDPTVDENSAPLIANAPTDLARLIKAVEAVEKLAEQRGSTGHIVALAFENELRAAIAAALTPTPAAPSGAGEPRGAGDEYLGVDEKRGAQKGSQP